MSLCVCERVKTLSGFYRQNKTQEKSFTGSKSLAWLLFVKAGTLRSTASQRVLLITQAFAVYSCLPKYMHTYTQPTTTKYTDEACSYTSSFPLTNLVLYLFL